MIPIKFQVSGDSSNDKSASGGGGKSQLFTEVGTYQVILKIIDFEINRVCQLRNT